MKWFFNPTDALRVALLAHLHNGCFRFRLTEKVVTGQVAMRCSAISRWRFRSIVAIALLVSLGSCARTVDTRRIEAAIQQDIETQGNVPVKWVQCPNRVAIAIGESFVCEGELSAGGTFTVQVEQQDELGNVTWMVQNSPALLNLAELEAYFQGALAAETVESPSVDCGSGLYRANAPNATFECQVMNATARDRSEVEAIVVTTDADGNLTWQQMRRQQIATTPATPTASAPGATPATTPTSTAEPASAPAADPSPTSDPNDGPPAASAEDFLNRPGALDGF